jgi:hypothetical protein
MCAKGVAVADQLCSVDPSNISAGSISIGPIGLAAKIGSPTSTTMPLLVGVAELFINPKLEKALR